MKLPTVVFWAVAAMAWAQEAAAPLASFTGTVRRIEAGAITLARPEQDDLDILCTRKTRYFAGSKKIKREEIKAGDRVSVETTLDPLLKPEAVNVRRLPPEGP